MSSTGVGVGIGDALHTIAAQLRANRARTQDTREKEADKLESQLDQVAKNKNQLKDEIVMMEKQGMKDTPDWISKSGELQNLEQIFQTSTQAYQALGADNPSWLASRLKGWFGRKQPQAPKYVQNATQTPDLLSAAVPRPGIETTDAFKQREGEINIDIEKLRAEALKGLKREEKIFDTDEAIRQGAPALESLDANRKAQEEQNRINQERLEANRIADNARADSALAQTTAQQAAQMEATAQRHREDIEQRRLDREQRAVIAEENARARGVDKPPTAQNLRVFGFYMRAKDAVDVMDEIEKDVQSMGTGEQYWTALMPNVLQTQLGQTLDQTQRQFTEARLRKDSGAAIPPHEYENDKRTYFVQPGDTKETLERKRKARGVLINALKMESGRAYTQSFGEDAAATGGGTIKFISSDGQRLEVDAAKWPEVLKRDPGAKKQ